MNIQSELAELKLTHAILLSYCTTTSAGLEAIDPKTFLSHLSKLTQKSGKLVRYILSNKDVTITRMLKKDFTLDRKVLATPFTKVASNNIYVPTSFSGYVSSFLELLLVNKDAMKLTNQALVDSNVIFSELLANPSLLNKLDPKRIPELDNIEDLPKEFGDFFKGAEGVDRVPMGDVYKSFNDYNVVNELLIKLTEEFNRVNLKDLKSSVDDFYETLDLIHKRIDQGEVEVSKPTAKAMGDLIYKLADWVAIYGLYLTKLSSSANAHKDTTEKLNGFF